MSLIKVLTTKKINLNQIITLVVLVIAGFVAINIHLNQNKRISQIQQLENEQREKNEMLLHIGDLKKKFNFYKKAFKPVDSREIISTITDLATVADLKIISLTAEKKSVALGISKVYNKVLFNLTIQVDGFHQLAKFISKLESNPMIFIIELVRIRGVSAGARELTGLPGRLLVELIISKPFLKD